MKIKLLTVLLFALAGCSILGSGPRATVEKYLSYAKEKNINGMNGLISNRFVSEMGSAKIEKSNQEFSDAAQKGDYKMQIISEETNADNAKISFFYKDEKKNDSVRLTFKLVKQNGDWKIDYYGFGGDPAQIDSSINEEPNKTPKMMEDLPPPPPPAQPTANRNSKAK